MRLNKPDGNGIWENGRATKGSQFWIQTIINSSMKKDLDRVISEKAGEKIEINWKWPLEENSFKEYDLTSIEKYRDSLNKNFWPLASKPEWDALGYDQDGVLYLVEAKAHIGEMSPRKESKSKSNDKIIKKTLEWTNNQLNGKKYEESIWFKDFYQLSNRLAFYSKLKKDKIKVKLIYLNFVNDTTNGKPANKKMWESYYRDISKKMFGEYNSIFDEILYYFEV